MPVRVYVLVRGLSVIRTCGPDPGIVKPRKPLVCLFSAEVAKSFEARSRTKGGARMVCELLLSSVWLLFVVFWVETISVWLFLCLFYQDRAFYHWGDGVFADDPGQMLYMLSRVERSEHTQT
ncbi:hypothetical protein AOLI_G00325860 [Acnodon oligacanthus]